MSDFMKCPYCGYIDDKCFFPDLIVKGCGFPSQEKLMEELLNLGYNLVTCGMCEEVIIKRKD